MVRAFSFVCFNQHYCKVEMSPGKDFSVLARANLTLYIAFSGLPGLSFFSFKIQKDSKSTPPLPAPPPQPLSSGNTQSSPPRLCLCKLPVGIDDSLWGLSIIPPLCPAVTSIWIWLTEEAWVICKEQQGFSFIILVGGQGANDWAWITQECGIQGRKKPNWLPNEGKRGCRWKVPG